jgi:hypothetical protein
MENQVNGLAAMLIVSGAANILLSILLILNEQDWTRRYVAQADRLRKEKNKPETPESQELIR